MKQRMLQSVLEVLYTFMKTICKSCHNEIDGEHDFCPKCGAVLHQGNHSKVEFDITDPNAPEEEILEDDGRTPEEKALEKFTLGELYRLGVAYPRDTERAFALFQEAASYGSLDAKCALALCYLTGEGTDVDYQKGLELLQEATKEGSSKAANLLIQMGEDPVFGA